MLLRYLLSLTFALFWFLAAYSTENSNVYLGSRENHSESLVENVSTIHGDYSEYEIDLIVPGPDSLVLSRFYSSRDHFIANFSLGGWRFNPHCYLSIQNEAPSN